MSKEQSFREALARIASGFYTEKGAENHAKDIIRLVDSQPPEVIPSNQRVSALVLNICSAYESGFGHGLDNTAAPNPYAFGTDEDCFGAWQYGHEQGSQRRSRIETKAECPHCREVYEIWANTEGFTPVTAPESYLQRAMEQMRDAAAKGLSPKSVAEPST